MPPTSRSTAARNAAWRTTTRASVRGGRMWRPGRRRRSCWLLTWGRAPMTPRDRAGSAAPGAGRPAGEGTRGGRVAMRADAGYFPGALARAAHNEHIASAIGARRIAPLWRLLDGIGEDDWRDATDMDNAQGAVAAWCPDWWPAATRLLVRRAPLDPGPVSPDPRSRPPPDLPPAHRPPPLPRPA